jgi:hypothetical protein
MKRKAKKTHVLGVPVTAAQKSAMIAEARKDGRTFAGWARRALLRACGETVPK